MQFSSSSLHECVAFDDCANADDDDDDDDDKIDAGH